jgi:hypothetical protein
MSNQAAATVRKQPIFHRGKASFGLRLYGLRQKPSGPTPQNGCETIVNRVGLTERNNAATAGLRWRARARLIEQAIEPVSSQAAAPLANRQFLPRRRSPGSPCPRQPPARSGRDTPSPARVFRARQRLQFPPLCLIQINCNRRLPRPGHLSLISFGRRPEVKGFKRRVIPCPWDTSTCPDRWDPHIALALPDGRHPDQFSF